MSKIKDCLKFYRHIFIYSDDVQEQVTTESQIKEINNCAQQLSESERRALIDSLNDVDKIENQYLTDSNRIKSTKVKVDEKKAINKMTEKSEKANVEKENEKN